jgi:hypothetical protein
VGYVMTMKVARIRLGYATGKRVRQYRLRLLSWQRMFLDASTIDFAILKGRIGKVRPLLKGDRIWSSTGPPLHGMVGRRTKMRFQERNVDRHHAPSHDIVDHEFRWFSFWETKMLTRFALG